MGGLGLKTVGAALPSVSYHPLSHMLGDREQGVSAWGSSFLTLDLFFNLKGLKSLLAILILNLEWPPYQLTESFCSFTAQAPVPLPLEVFLTLSYICSTHLGLQTLHLILWGSTLLLYISFSQLESNITEDKDHNSGFSVTLTTRHNSRHFLFAEWLPDLMLLLMAPCCLQVKI